MSAVKDIESLIRVETYEIDSAETENDMQYHYGKAMAYAGLLCTLFHRYREYMLFLREIDEVVQSRRSRGFPQAVGGTA